MLYEHENGKTEMKTVVLLLENVVNSSHIADIKASLENHLYLWVVSRGNEFLSPSSFFIFSPLLQVIKWVSPLWGSVIVDMYNTYIGIFIEWKVN